MKPGILAVLLLLAGPAIGWLLVAGMCSLPGLRYSVACGHNAGLWLVLAIPLGFLMGWLALQRISRALEARQAARSSDRRW